MKRPTSHKWAIFVFIAFIAVNVRLAINEAFDVDTGLILVLSCCALVGSFLFTHSRRTYLVAALALTLIVIRGLYYGVFQPAQQLLTQDAAAQQGWPAVGFQAFLLVLLCLLLRAYIFGAASRQFYGYTLPSTTVG